MAKEREVNIIVDAKNKAKGAFLEVKKDLRQLGEYSKEGLGKLTSSFDKADKVIYSFADRMKWMDKIAKRTFQGTAAAAGVYIGATLRDFTQLNDGISKVNTLYDQTAESQRKMYQDSIKMFGLIPTNFEKITQGIYDTISAGADPKYATMMARKFGMAGVAGDAGMDVVTKAAMGTMNAYKAEVKDLTKILDLQFMTVKKGITSYEELASSLGTGVLASAESAGITMEELYGSIAMITKNAIPAAVATTSLNQMFNKFTDTKVIKEFKNFGVEIQDANRNTRPLIEIMKDLNYQFDRRKMTSEERKGFLKEIVGSEQAARALTPLLSDLKEFQNILDAMDNSSGSMQDAYNDRLESIKTQIQLMWNSLKATGVEQIEKLNPLVEAITGPWIKKNKIEMEIANLEDSLEFTNDPAEKKLIRQEIRQLELELNDIDLTPVEEFRDALAESVEELNKFSPALGGFIDKLGNFIIDHLGEEGSEQREETSSWIKRIRDVWLLSLGSRMFKNTFGKTPWEVGKWLIPKGFQVGKGAAETLYLQILYAKDALTKGKNLKAGIYIPEEYEVGGEKFNEFQKQILDIIDSKNDTKRNPQNSVIESISSTKLIDELLKLDQIKQTIDNNVSLQNKMNMEPPKVDVNTKVYIDGKNIPIQRVDVDHVIRAVEKHTERQATRYGRPLPY